MKLLLGLLIVAGAAYLALAAFAHFAADRLIFLPPPGSYVDGELPIVRIPVGDRAHVAAVHLPHDSARYTLLFSHGNAEDLGHAAPFLRELRDRVGVSVVGYDYRGYGLSTPGPPTARTATHDARAVYRYMVSELAIPPERIIVHGRSVGTGPALELAARAPVGGAIVESGFTSAFRVVTRLPILPFDRFPNLRNIRRLRAPVLVIHGQRDEVIAFWHGRSLYAAAPEPKDHLWVPAATHNDLMVVAGEDYWEGIRDFIRSLEAPRAVK